jgi:hypothetical protein
MIDGLTQAVGHYLNVAGQQPRGATLPQAPEGLTVWTPTPWPDDRTVLGFSVHDLNRLPRILERMRALREVLPSRSQNKSRRTAPLRVTRRRS